MEGQERMEKEKAEKNGNKMEEGEQKEEKEKISSGIVSVFLSRQDLE